MRPKPATRCAASSVDPVEREVGEAGEHFRLGLAVEIAPARLRVVGHGRRPHQHHAGALQRIALLALVDHQRDARVGEDVLGVHGKARDQQQRRAVGRGRDVHQRAIGIARTGHQRRQRPGAALAQELLGGNLGVEIGRGVHGRLCCSCHVSRALAFGNRHPQAVAGGNLPLALRRDASYVHKAFDESRVCQRFVTFRPSFAGFKAWGETRDKGLHADHRSRRRRPQYPDVGLDRARGRGLPDHDLHRRRLGARRLQDVAARSRHPRHQDAAHGRHGDLAPAAPEVRHAGDLPHLQGRGDRRVVRPQDGRRRFHPQTVLAASAGRARQGGAPPRGRRRTAPRRRRPTPPRCSSAVCCAWTPSATPAPGRTSR